MDTALFLRPRLSEQTYALAQKDRVYVFDVPMHATKHEVARAVAAQFNVKVADVNTTGIKGKVKRTISLTGRRQSNRQGAKQDIKKAYVKLAKGFSLPIFASIDEAQEKERKLQEQADKAMAKQSTKETTKSVAAAPAKPARRGGIQRIFKKQGDK